MVRRSESFYFALTVDLLANLYFSPFGSTKKRFTAYQVGTLPLFYPLSLPLVYPLSLPLFGDAVFRHSKRQSVCQDSPRQARDRHTRKV